MNDLSTKNARRAGMNILEILKLAPCRALKCRLALHLGSSMWAISYCQK